MNAQRGLGSTRRTLHAFLARKLGSMPTTLLSTKMQLTTMLKSNGYFLEQTPNELLLGKI
jgi:hypothetical protein